MNYLLPVLFALPSNTTVAALAGSNPARPGTDSCRVAEEISSVGRKIHAPPIVIGIIATQTGVGQLLLSYFMARSLENVEENLQEIRSHYTGSLVVANDLDRIKL